MAGGGKTGPEPHITTEEKNCTDLSPEINGKLVQPLESENVKLYVIIKNYVRLKLDLKKPISKHYEMVFLRCNVILSFISANKCSFSTTSMIKTPKIYCCFPLLRKH